MCSTREEYFARIEAQKTARQGGGCDLSPDEKHDLREIRTRSIPASILLHDPGDETAHDPEPTQDERIAQTEGQIDALVNRLVALAVSHAILKARYERRWQARIEDWFRANIYDGRPIQAEKEKPDA